MNRPFGSKTQNHRPLNAMWVSCGFKSKHVSDGFEFLVLRAVVFPPLHTMREKLDEAWLDGYSFIQQGFAIKGYFAQSLLKAAYSGSP